AIAAPPRHPSKLLLGETAATVARLVCRHSYAQESLSRRHRFPRQLLYRAVAPPALLPQTPHPAQPIQSALRQPVKDPEGQPAGLVSTVLIASLTTRCRGPKAGSKGALYLHRQRLAVPGGGWSAPLPPQQPAPRRRVRRPPATTNSRRPGQAE